MARVRISDVATAAGVSTATVSLVLNERDVRIPAETRERVRRAAAEIGYTPNSVARGLRLQRTRTIGLISDQIATTPFAGRMLAGAQDVAREHDYLVFLVDTGADSGVESRGIAALAAQQVDAMIYAAMWHRVVDEVPAGLPPGTVFLDCRPAGGGFPSVVPDDYAGGAAATRELLAAGHTRIAYVDVDEPEKPIAAGLRHQAYVDTLRAAGLEPDPALHQHARTSAGGREAVEALLDLPLERRPTALFCFNDRVAAGAYVAAHRRGMDVPGDLSVVGYDDQQLVASELDPPLTTVALPHYDMGRWAMEVVVGARPAPADGAAHLMPCPIVRRASVGPPPTSVTPGAGDGR